MVFAFLFMIQPSIYYNIYTLVFSTYFNKAPIIQHHSTLSPSIHKIIYCSKLSNEFDAVKFYVHCRIYVFNFLSQKIKMK